MIGILAGMGPMSTAPFIEALMIAWRKKFDAKHDMDYPHVVIYSLPTPFYLDREINHQELEQSIVQGLIRLKSWGATLIAMPCNTAHRYFEQLQASINVPLLNIIDATLAKLPNNPENVTLFATQSTFESNIYQEKLKRIGIPFIFETVWQDDVNLLISAVKAGEDQLINIKVNNLVRKIKEKGVQSIIIGCTDISVAICKAVCDSDMVAIDSSACLVEAIISEFA